MEVNNVPFLVLIERGFSQIKLIGTDNKYRFITDFSHLRREDKSLNS